MASERGEGAVADHEASHPSPRLAREPEPAGPALAQPLDVCCSHSRLVGAQRLSVPSELHGDRAGVLSGEE